MTKRDLANAVRICAGIAPDRRWEIAHRLILVQCPHIFAQHLPGRVWVQSPLPSVRMGEARWSLPTIPLGQYQMRSPALVYR